MDCFKNTLELIKLAGVILTSYVAFRSLKTDFTGDDGKLTISGKRIKRLAIAVGLISIIAFIGEWFVEKFQDQRAKENTAAQLERMKEALAGVNRSLSTFKNIEMYLSTGIYYKHPALRNFRDSLVDRLTKDKILEDSKGSEPVYQVLIGSNRPEWPSKSYVFPFAVCSRFEALVYFYKKPIDFKDHITNRVWEKNGGSRIKEADLAMTFLPDGIKTLLLSYHFSSDQFSLQCDKMKTDSREWRNSGKIASTLDLVGSQLFIKVVHQPVYINDETFTELYDVHTLRLSFGQGQEIVIPQGSMKVHRNRSGEGYFEYRFPNTLEKLDSLFENSPRYDWLMKTYIL